MNKKEKKYIVEVYNDCMKLVKEKTLTEFGRGQLYLSAKLLNKNIKGFK